MQLREPVAWVALGALVLNLVLALVGLATLEGPMVSMGWMWSERVANPTPLLALTALVSSCVLGKRTPHARQLTLTSLVVGAIAVSLGLTLALLGIGATAPIVVVLAAIVPQVISIVAVGVLIKFLQLQTVPRRLPAEIGMVVPEHLRRDIDHEGVNPLDSPPATAAHQHWPQPTSDTEAAASAAWVVAVEARPWAVGWGTDAPTVRWQDIPASSNGPAPEGWATNHPAVQPTVPMPEQQPPSQPEDPQVDYYRQWNSQRLAIDWSGNARP